MSDEEPESWPAHLPVARTRVARAVRDLDETRRFYGDALGLVELGSFSDHAGYSGVFYGLPGGNHHLEFTWHAEEAPGTPSADDLLVFYFDDPGAVDALVARLARHGFRTVAPANPYWETVERSATVEDPDGVRVVLVAPRVAA